MPSSANYVRDYKQERLAEAPRRRKQRAMRNKAHATLERVLGKEIKGDVDHKRELSRGGSNNRSNLQVMRPSKNRSYKRTSSGAIA